jgi:lipopolysaccharide export system protein LptC
MICCVQALRNPSQQRFGLSHNWAVRSTDQLLHSLARTTRLVMVSKWSLAAIAGILMIMLVAWPYFSKENTALRISFVSKGGKSSSATPGARMTNPVYDGKNSRGEPYRVQGKVAIQQSADVIVLEQVEAQLMGDAGTWYSLSADKAEYRKSANRVDLIGNVTLIDARGYSFTTPNASIDTLTSVITGDETITGIGPLGELLATGFEIRNNAQDIHFGKSGRVVLTIRR